jgi:hypothetical protein
MGTVAPVPHGHQCREPGAGEFGGTVHDVLERGAQFEVGADTEDGFEERRQGVLGHGQFVGVSSASGSILPSSM